MPSPESPYRRPERDTMSLATLAGVVAILVITFTNMRDIDRLDRTLGDRLDKMENQIAQAPRPAAGAPAAAAADPNRIYTVKVAADAPMRGRAAAPVTIAEFSDFQ